MYVAIGAGGGGGGSSMMIPWIFFKEVLHALSMVNVPVDDQNPEWLKQILTFKFILVYLINIGDVGKTASMSMLTLFESRYT